MITIKFRGKRLDNGEWVYGDLLQTNEGSVCIGIHGQYIDDGMHFNDFYDETPYIDEDTVGQLTGMLDSNGKEIYEGDILSDGEVKYEVWYSEDRAGFIAEMRDPQNDLVDYLGGYDTERMMTIIGNLHDNPELLNEK